jgi:hypothetical protein
LNEKEVEIALKIVDKALDDKTFLKWVERNRSLLEYDYDQYSCGSFGALEEPEGFYYFCLGRYLGRRFRIRKGIHILE